MKIRKRLFTNKNARVLLSELLPYELPVSVSNRALFHFVSKYNIKLKGGKLYWDNRNNDISEMVKSTFGLNQNSVVQSVPTSRVSKYIELKDTECATIPFQYRILHKSGDYRELTMIHPLNQLIAVEFYDKYKDLILYYSTISEFSIRKPYRVAKYCVPYDLTFWKKYSFDHEHASGEEMDLTYSTVKSFFVYRRFSNVHKFFESTVYHHCEKKFDKLLSFDIAKCFDSIYTHSLLWALYGKDSVKEVLGQNRDKKTFGSQFDLLMRNLNCKETNGIVIGPELSRIFAELILQQIDRRVMLELKSGNDGLRHKVDYQLFRYVDDYFLFYNNDDIADKVLTNYKIALKEFKLSINTAKTHVLEKPLITGISRAKLRISKMLDDYFRISFAKEDEDGDNSRITIHVSSSRLRSEFKSIIVETGVNPGDITNYVIACIERRISSFYKKVTKNNLRQNDITTCLSYFISVIDFCFYLYSLSPKVSPSIKLCLVLSKIIRFTRVQNALSHDQRHLIYKKIFDEINVMMMKLKVTENAEVESLYLLTVINELGRDYELEEAKLKDYFRITISWHPNYLTIVVLLRLIGDKGRYAKTKSALEKAIIAKYENVTAENRRKNAELVYLFMDMISCPYLDNKIKKKLFILWGLENKFWKRQRDILAQAHDWEKNWISSDFGIELLAKKGREVY